MYKEIVGQSVEDKPQPYLTAKQQIQVLSDLIDSLKKEIAILKDDNRELQIQVNELKGKAGGRRNSA